MKKELLIKSIELLEKDLLSLRKDKVLLYTEMDITKKEIEVSNKRNLLIQEENNKLVEKNKELESENNQLDNNIALLHKKEANYIQKEIKGIAELNKLILRALEIKDDIVNLETDKTYISRSNSVLGKQILWKRVELEDLDIQIANWVDNLKEIKNNIKLFEEEKIKLNEKEHSLIIKESFLNKRENRLDDLKKDLLSKK